MQNNISFFQPVFNSLMTTQEANTLMESIDQTQNEMFKLNRGDLFAKLTQGLSQSLTNGISQTMQQNNIANSNLSVLQSFLQRLQDAVKSCDVLGMRIAIPDTQNLILHLSPSVKALFGPTTILEISVDQTLLGGAVITWQGNYYDVSLKHKLDNYFL